MRILLPALLVAAPAAAQHYDFQISQRASHADVAASFEIVLPGHLIGNYDADTNPTGTRTLPGLFGGSGNQPVDSEFGFLGATGFAGAPSGGFGLTLAPADLTLSVDGLDLDLLGGAQGSSDLTLHLEFETFRTFEPTSLYLGDFPIDVPLGSQTIQDALVVQSAPSLGGILVPEGRGDYRFSHLIVPVELTFTLVVAEEETPVGPLPLLLFLEGTLSTSGDGATLSTGFVLTESQVIEDPVPGFELVDVPLDLPTFLPPGQIAHLLLDAVIESLALDVAIDVAVLADGEADCGFESYCEGNPNSAGRGALLSGLGSSSIGANDLTFVGSALPPEHFTYLMMATGRDEVPFFRGSQGTLCLSMPILKFTPHVVPTGRTGEMSLEVDYGNLPPGVEIVAGQTWDFQLWYRDDNPGTTTNTSNAIEVVFCP